MPRIHLVSWDNGVGLTRDLALIARALRADPAFAVAVSRRGRGKLRKWGRPIKLGLLGAAKALARRFGAQPYDANVELEHVWPAYASWARRTAFVPNPEWFDASDRQALAGVDLVLAKTRLAERLFRDLGKDVAYIGFTSEDRLDRAVTRERAFFHLAGRSKHKGTQALVALWKDHPHWPTLTIVQSPRVARTVVRAPNIDHRVDYLDDAQLRRLQNAHRFHLCPSEAEGYGHYLVEAMSVGAVVITTDAAPMNELVTPERGLLVAATPKGAQGLVPTFAVDPAALHAAVEAALALDDARVAQLGAAARTWYEANDAAFGPRLRAALGGRPG